MSPRQPIKLSDLDKSRMKHGGLLNKHICDFFSNISSETAESVNFHFSHYKSIYIYISCHGNQSSFPTGIKNTSYIGANVLSMYAKYRLHPPYGSMCEVLIDKSAPRVTVWNTSNARL